MRSMMKRVDLGKPRLKAIGGYFVDLSKYVLTAGLVARVIQGEKFQPSNIGAILLVSLITLVVGVSIIPKEEK